MRQIKVGDIGFKLKKACNECPFRTTTPLHQNIAVNIPHFASSADRGLITFSCHKTDKRADSIEGRKYKGQVQHCAGLLALMKKDKEILSNIAVMAEKKGKLKLKMTRGIYKSFYRMVVRYSEWIKEGMPGDLLEINKAKLKAAGYKILP